MLLQEYQIKVTSKNRPSIAKFYEFFRVNLEWYCLEDAIFILQAYPTTNVKKTTILKSPHVNKKSQETYEYRLFSKKIKVACYSNTKLFLVIKKLKTFMASDIDIKITLTHGLEEKIIPERMKLLKETYIKEHKNSLKPSGIAIGLLTIFRIYGESIRKK